MSTPMILRAIPVRSLISLADSMLPGRSEGRNQSRFGVGVIILHSKTEPDNRNYIKSKEIHLQMQAGKMQHT